MHPLSTRFGYWLCLALALGVLLAPGSLSAATYIVPPDADLIREADAIAIVTIQSSRSYWTEDGRSIATDYEAIVESPLKAAPFAGSKITITQKGGTVEDLTQFVSSQPEFHDGERALLMMRRLPMLRFTTISGELGKFSFVRDAKARQLVVRGASEGEIFGWDIAGWQHMERPRDAAAFVRYIEAIVANEDVVPDYQVEGRESLFRADGTSGCFPGKAYTNSSGGLGIGWPAGFSMQSVGTQTGVTNLTGSINTSRNTWNGDPNSTISIGYGGAYTGTGQFRDNDNKNLIFLDQPTTSPDLGGNIVGLASWTIGATSFSHNGEDYHPIVDCDILIEEAKTGTWFEAILAHEMGHCLGFRHSDQGTPSTGTALMKSSTNSGDTATLRQWDRDAASVVYGSGGPGSTQITQITVQPLDKTITDGQLTNLSVTADGASPFTYQWYSGANTDSNPDAISGPAGTSNPLNVRPPFNTTPYSYWVRVTGCNGSVADSRTAIVTVTCAPPSITGQPQNKSITTGTSTTLSVSATGSSLSYQWYRGTAPDDSDEIGTNSATFNTGTLTSTTSFWVRVSGACGTPAESNTATVTTTSAGGCPDVIVQTPTAAKQFDGSYVLDVIATGGSTFSYAWFRGATPGSGGDFVGSARQITVPAPTAPTSYWVRVSNNCDKTANSTVVTIGICDLLPVLDSEPGDQSILNGASATLTFTFTSATSATVRWYRGIAPDKTTEVGVGTSFNTGPLTTTTQFWASVTNSCGETVTRTVTITVTQPICTPPSILTTSTAQTRLKGETVTLNVNAAGTAVLHYQWYEGIAGDISHPVGSDAASFTSDPLTKTTKFWVNVTNDCGNAPSAAIDVTVRAPRRRAARS